MKKVSVCIATHNGGKYIKEQLDSILCQLNNNDEIIISDDGSSDDTLQQILSYNDPRIHIYQIVHQMKGMRPHYYVTKNFENALRQVTGDYIFLADQDDVWMPNKVSYCVNLLQMVDLVITNLECVDSLLNPLGMNIYSERFHFHNFLLLKGKYYGCAMAFRKEVLQFALPFPPRLVLHDYWIGILTEIFGKVIYVNVPFVKYRQHNHNTSSNHKPNTLFYKLWYRSYVVWNIVKRSFTKFISAS